MRNGRETGEKQRYASQGVLGRVSFCSCFVFLFFFPWGWHRHVGSPDFGCLCYLFAFPGFYVLLAYIMKKLRRGCHVEHVLVDLLELLIHLFTC